MKSIKQQFVESAKMLGYNIDFTKLLTYDPTRSKIVQMVADRYIGTTNEFDRSSCIAALLLMFWPESHKMKAKCAGVSDYEDDDFVQHLYLCIQTACDYAAWKDGHTTAEACIRSAIASRGAAAILYESNLDIHKANSNTMNLDGLVADDNERTAFVDTLQDERAQDFDEELEVESIIQSYINQNKVVEAIILDNIAFNDVEKVSKETIKVIGDDGVEKKYTQYSREFWPYKLAQLLSALPADYCNYFTRRYSVDKNLFNAALNNISSLNSKKLYTSIERTIESLRISMAA